MINKIIQNKIAKLTRIAKKSKIAENLKNLNFKVIFLKTPGVFKTYRVPFPTNSNRGI